MITTKICPNCGSEDVHMIAGGVTGSWMCKKCGHRGAVFEKEIIQRTESSLSRKLPKNKKKFPVEKEQKGEKKK
jgi:ribosomal protein L37AE/L43A